MKKSNLWVQSALCAVLLTSCAVQPGPQQGQETSSSPPQSQGQTPTSSSPSQSQWSQGQATTSPSPSPSQSEATISPPPSQTADTGRPDGGGQGVKPTPTAGMQGPLPDAVDQYAQSNEAQQGEALGSNAAIGTEISSATMHDYLEVVLTDVHNYWTSILTAAGYPAPQIAGYYFPMPGASYRTMCADRNGPVVTNDASMLYCPADDSIFFSQAAATDVWNGVYRVNNDPVAASDAGDFSVAYLVAHEYAHNVQMELGIMGAGYPVYKTELQADCLAGTWANSAYYAGYLEGGDIEEVQRTTLDIGDYGIDHPQHHGTPLQRNTAFMQGYDTGQPSQCDIWVQSNY